MHVQKAYPEHEKEVQAAVDLIFQQGMTIKLLEEALEQVRSELKGVMDDLDGDALEVV